MATINERIENLEVKFKKLPCRFRIVEVGVADKLAKIDETIRRLFEALLFNRAGETSNNHVLFSFKSHSRSVERESHDNFEDGKPQFASRLVKLEFSRVCGDDKKVWCASVEQFFNYQVTPNSQKVPLNSFHLKAETKEWWQWLKYAYKEEDKED